MSFSEWREQRNQLKKANQKLAISRLKIKRRELGEQYQFESKRKMLEGSIAKIKTGRDKINPTGWQRVSAKAKPWMEKIADNMEKASKSKGRKRKPSMSINWDYFR